jgi:hypothetical protein
MPEEEIIEAVNITDEDFLKISKKIVNLDALVFDQGGHFNSNEKLKIP